MVSLDLQLQKRSKETPSRADASPNDDALSQSRCSINLACVSHNIDILRERLPPHSRLMATIKASGYGTEDITMAEFLATQGVDIFGVAFVSEALRLRCHGVSQSIFVVNILPDEVDHVAHHGFEVGVGNKQVLAALCQAAQRHDTTIKIHLQVNTGMGRFGCRCDEALELASAIANTPGIYLEGLMTHLACAEDPSKDAFTQQQYTRFEQVYKQLLEAGHHIPFRHAANSAAVLRHKLPICNMARVGLALYGLNSSSALKNAHKLHLAVTLTSRVVAINTCRAGDTISYSSTYQVQHDSTRIAVIPLGYFDGIHRHYSGKGHVLIRGHRAPMVGNVCMDYMMVDISDIPDVTLGDEVLIFGRDANGHELPPELFAAAGGSITHELISCLGPRIQRRFVYE